MLNTDETSRRLLSVHLDYIIHTCSVHEKRIVMMKEICAETVLDLRFFNPPDHENLQYDRISRR
jgi:hypothetical protein